jgi:hypothetical protein
MEEEEEEGVRIVTYESLRSHEMLFVTSAANSQTGFSHKNIRRIMKKYSLFHFVPTLHTNGLIFITSALQTYFPSLQQNCVNKKKM